MNQKLTLDATTLLSMVEELNSEFKAKDQDNETLARVLIALDEMNKAIESKCKVVKDELKERSIETIVDTDLKKKVYLSEGKSSTEYNIEAIFNKVPANDFLTFINIVKSRIENEEYKKIVEFHSKSVKGNPYIAVGKLTKEELSKLQG